MALHVPDPQSCAPRWWGWWSQPQCPLLWSDPPAHWRTEVRGPGGWSAILQTTSVIYTKFINFWGFFVALLACAFKLRWWKHFGSWAPNLQEQPGLPTIILFPEIPSFRGVFLPQTAWCWKKLLGWCDFLHKRLATSQKIILKFSWLAKHLATVETLLTNVEEFQYWQACARLP